MRTTEPMGLAPPDSSVTQAGRPLVIVSNRLPFTLVHGPDGARFERSPGGLVAALDPALAARGGVWIGWAGSAAEQREDEVPPFPTGPPHVHYRGVPLSAREVALYYGAFANRALWPLLHYFPSRTHVESAAWTVYDRVNQRFGEAAAAESDDDALVWIHDYQLMRAPHHLRTLAPRRRIAFFLHIPFPAYDVFRLLPWARQLMQGLVAADLVSFHVTDYARHFITCAERLLGCEVDRPRGLVHWNGRVVTVAAHPIGIDVDGIERLAAGAPAAAGPEEPALVLGVDRLDITKGVLERLHAVELLLERYPEHRRRVVFMQIVVPSREQVEEYRALKRQIDETVGRINGRFSDAGWTPIRYLARSLSTADLVPLYRRADVALVTPLRDGMNLVAKEYVAAQLEDDGVLVLSEFAGAAEELQEALIVNPLDMSGVADTLHRALTMPPDERHARMATLRDRVRSNPVGRWVSNFLDAAEEASERAQRDALSPADAVLHQLAGWLAERPRTALFLDYDGTLTPIVRRPELALLTAEAREVLRRAALSPHLDVTIVSGRQLEDVRAKVAIPGLTYVGNHGFEIEGPGLTHRPVDLGPYLEPLERAARALAALDVPGAYVERKGATLTFHVRETPEEHRRTAERRARDVLRREGLRVTRGKLVIEGRPPIPWGKGHAVLHVLTQRYGAEWPARTRAIYLGDDTTDEDAFQSLRGIGRSIFVGQLPAGGHTADLTLPDPATVIQLLRRLVARTFVELASEYPV